MQKFLKGGNISGMFRKPVRNWYLIFRDLLSGGYGSGNGGVVSPYLDSALVTSIVV